jgi:hypothetical protein
MLKARMVEGEVVVLNLPFGVRPIMVHRMSRNEDGANIRVTGHRLYRAVLHALGKGLVENNEALGCERRLTRLLPLARCSILGGFTVGPTWTQLGFQLDSRCVPTSDVLRTHERESTWRGFLSTSTRLGFSPLPVQISQQKNCTRR